MPISFVSAIRPSIRHRSVARIAAISWYEIAPSRGRCWEPGLGHPMQNKQRIYKRNQAYAFCVQVRPRISEKWASPTEIHPCRLYTGLVNAERCLPKTWMT